jgi:hypothetical protein
VGINEKFEDMIELFEGHPHPHHFQTNALPLIVVNIFFQGNSPLQVRMHTIKGFKHWWQTWYLFFFKKGKGQKAFLKDDIKAFVTSHWKILQAQWALWAQILKVL